MEQQRLTFTVGEVAKLLGISRQLAYTKVREGQIPCLRIGRRLLVPRRALEKLLEEGRLVDVTLVERPVTR